MECIVKVHDSLMQLPPYIKVHNKGAPMQALGAINNEMSPNMVPTQSVAN